MAYRPGIAWDALTGNRKVYGEGAFGAKPASAVPVVTAPAAVASAVRAATGRPIGRLPIRPQAAVAQTPQQ